MTADPPALGRFVLLSLLVHFFLVVLFGNTTGTGPSSGSSTGAPLGVRLRALSSEARPNGAPGASTESIAAALLRTLAGSKSVASPQPATSARSQIPARPALPQPPTANRAEPVPATSATSAAGLPARDAVPLPQPPKIEPLPELNFSAPEPVDLPLKPSPITPAPVERTPAPPVEAPVTPKVERPPPPALETPREVVPVRPAPTARPDKESPPIERTPTPPVAVPQVYAPTPPAAPLERVAPSAAPEVTPAVQPAPRAVTPPAPVENTAPPSLERAVNPPAERAVREVPSAPAAAPSPASSAPAAAPSTAPAPAGRDNGVPDAQRSRLGAPDGRDDIFKPRLDVAPGLVPGAAPAPRLDLDAARQRARELATEGSGSRGLLPLQIQVPADRRSKLAESLEKAAKPDCRNAYANMGLLAVPALVAGAVADVGCRW